MHQKILTDYRIDKYKNSYCVCDRDVKTEGRCPICTYKYVS